MKLLNLFYFFILVFTISGPLALSFDKKVHFNSYFKSAFLASFIIGIPFIIWDMIFTHFGIWGFNYDYLIGLEIINLPLEEILFFLIIPFAFLFTYECIRVYFDYNFWNWVSRVVIILFMSILTPLAILNIDDIYTAVVLLIWSATCIFTLIKLPKWYSNFLVSFLITLIPFYLVDGAITGNYTTEPMVWYNNLETLGIRVGTIPIEDFVYSYVMLFWNVFVFEKLRSKNRKALFDSL
ncbi:MAG: lycopene cyclase domain-containing protein [Salibacteraceae bacterium]